jgi:hypothetical protein
LLRWLHFRLLKPAIRRLWYWKGKSTRFARPKAAGSIALDSNRRLFVEFGEAFTVPKDIAGKRALVAGSFYRDSISVEKQRENAKADGASEEKINAITTPLVEVNFKAGGVKLLR